MTLEPVPEPPAEAVAPVFAPASVPPAEPEPARPRVDVSGLMQRRQGPVEKAKADLGKVLASPKVLGRRPSRTPEGEMCRHRLLFCQECHGPR